MHDCKIDAFMELIEQLNGQHALVFYSFQHDRDRLMQALTETKLRVRVYANAEDEASYSSLIISSRLTSTSAAAILTTSSISSLCITAKEALTPDEARRWDALYMRYIGDERLSVDTIAEKLNIDRRTFYRDISLAMEDLAVLLFGIEAIGARKNC